jgi:hypothetical protein
MEYCTLYWESNVAGYQAMPESDRVGTGRYDVPSPIKPEKGRWE